MKQPEISVAIPLYNEEENVKELYQRLKNILIKYKQSYEIIFTDDGSTDKTIQYLSEIKKKDPRVKIVCLSRNFGHEAAVSAALNNTVGNLVVLMDGDLQDAPEFIPEMVKKLNEGYDVVFARHNKRHDPPVKKFLFKSFYFTLDKLASYKFPADAGTFCVMRRTVADILCQLTERNRFLAGLRSWVGFRQTGIEYEKQSRFAGRPSQTFKKLLSMGFDALFSFSFVPLRLATVLGIIVNIGGFLAVLDVLYQKFVAHTAILGWSGPMLSILIIGGAQLTILGIIGEYLGRIYDEVKRRPYYIIAKII